MLSLSHKLHYLLPKKVGNIRNRETTFNSVETNFIILKVELIVLRIVH
jgi:hypothetical protein